jgi:hypothetical protein
MIGETLPIDLWWALWIRRPSTGRFQLLSSPGGRAAHAGVTQAQPAQKRTADFPYCRTMETVRAKKIRAENIRAENKSTSWLAAV